MRLFVTGGTGFIGSRLVPHLVEHGHEVDLLVRPSEHRRGPALAAAARVFVGDGTEPGDHWASVAACDGAVNLAGTPVFRRWTDRVKKDLRESRLETTRNLTAAVPADRPFVLVSASGIGIFGDAGEKELDEDALPGGDFLAGLAVEWEAAALTARTKGARVAVTRFGMVLGSDGGALPQLVQNTRHLLGGPLGSGRQWTPWIHREDVVNAIRFVLETDGLEGAFNFVAPGRVRQHDFAKALGRVLHCPASTPTPGLALRLLYGEFGKIALYGQNAVPRHLLEAGFSFRFPGLDEALRDLIDPGGDTQGVGRT